MKIKTGIDIIEIERVKGSMENTAKFIERVFTQNEIEYCESKKTQKYQHYAARFAAKEAVFKAISNGVDNKYEVAWKNIEILNDEQGRPSVNLIDLDITEENIMAKIWKEIDSIDLSISHCKDYAVASVAIIFK